jgi:hypothetical protein
MILNVNKSNTIVWCKLHDINNIYSKKNFNINRSRYNIDSMENTPLIFYYLNFDMPTYYDGDMINQITNFTFSYF